MKYILQSRPKNPAASHEDDPLSGVANLFDVALVFIVALFLSLMSTFQILDFLDPDTDITLMKKVENQWQIIEKKGKEVTVKKVTDRTVGGREGVRLGTAYQLKDGRVIYIPSSEEQEADQP
ncbi:DUF2149 domain-containing protein [Desulfotignum balticum]|jgi:hypothetical protein|uniref:DUF2149 domain-containing protein n=1 Tax=Desulfotignum balticum TaxID=115781 RepID=UPI00041AACFB|nr:DUF2149 domain-containing protein [Desulfotignum balticum]